MKTPLILPVILAAAGAVHAIPAVDAPAPAFVARDAAGKTVSLAAFRGKTVVLEWTNDGCPFVGHMYNSGVMQGLQRNAAADGVVWLTVISSAPGKQGFLAPAQVGPWKARVGAAPADVLLDPGGQLGRAYDARTTPNMVVIDRTGRMVYEGAIDDDPSTNPADAHKARNYVALALADLRDGRPVAPAVTKSYGCSVKYP
ncbi:MAG TPA: redoxin family protein [Caulobacteraceae bacterium]|jgi:hypothetical protein|nr:redoxin family protein [Caulobacteraceae bacterium]